MKTLSQDTLENPDYVARLKAEWPSLPISMTVIEFWGDGDGYFGGSSDDRPLMRQGHIRRDIRESYQDLGVANFATIEAAHEAAKLIPNRREGSILGVSPSWR
jgi:hypothetical protein